MASLQEILPPNLYDKVERSGLSSVRNILLLSSWDLQKMTHLNIDDLNVIMNIVSSNLCPKMLKGNFLYQNECEVRRVTTGCDVINGMLDGGLRSGTITEIYGESGSGKTQFAIQAAIHNWQTGCVYLCTENLFPTKRYEQIKLSLPQYCKNTDYGKSIFIEHVTEPHELLSCVKVRLPRLVKDNELSLIVLDSVAAPYRSEMTNYVQRAEELRELAIALMNLAQEHKLAVLCINQVTAAFDESDNVLPSLGLAWSNLVTTRLHLKKTKQLFDLMSVSHKECGYDVYIRELSVVFAPDLSNKMVKICITPNGIQNAQF